MDYDMVFLYQMEHMVKQFWLIAINQTMTTIKAIDPNNNSGWLGFWNDIKLYIEKT